MSLRVLQPGLQSLLVDAGRPRTRSLGVPLGGAADREALALGNALLGNASDACALEVTLLGPTLRAESVVGAVLFGAPFSLVRDDRPLTMGVPFSLQPGQTLRIGSAAVGIRAYLCVVGGFTASPLLGSRSALEPLTSAQVLPCRPSSAPRWFFPPEVTAPWTAPPDVTPLHCLPGPQADWFPLTAFLDTVRIVQAVSNRMGLRLLGEALPKTGREMVSEPVAPGTVQVANDGQCMVLGVDGQTIGGYPKIAHVIRADLDLLGRLRPGNRVRFVWVDATTADEREVTRRRRLRSWIVRCRALHGDSSGTVEPKPL